MPISMIAMIRKSISFSKYHILASFLVCLNYHRYSALQSRSITYYELSIKYKKILYTLYEILYTALLRKAEYLFS